VRGAVDEIARVHRGRRVALVTHLGVIRTLVPGVRLGHLEISRIEHDAG
jgi:broad specificity phosphatase PhoE